MLVINLRNEDQVAHTDWYWCIRWFFCPGLRQSKALHEKASIEAFEWEQDWDHTRSGLGLCSSVVECKQEDLGPVPRRAIEKKKKKQHRTRRCPAQPTYGTGVWPRTKDKQNPTKMVAEGSPGTPGYAWIPGLQWTCTRYIRTRERDIHQLANL